MYVGRIQGNRDGRALADIMLPATKGSGSRDILVKAFSSFCLAARKIIAYAPPDVGVWVLYDMDSLPTWNRDKLVLIGDAAHPFLPCTTTSPQDADDDLVDSDLDLGQGGAMAIESAACIAQLLPADTKATDLTDRLALYTEIRYERAEHIRHVTRLNGLAESERPRG
jgi:hypothetical protein